MFSAGANPREGEEVFYRLRALPDGVYFGTGDAARDRGLSWLALERDNS